MATQSGFYVSRFQSRTQAARPSKVYREYINLTYIVVVTSTDSTYIFFIIRANSLTLIVGLQPTLDYG